MKKLNQLRRLIYKNGFLQIFRYFLELFLGILYTTFFALKSPGSIY